MVTAARIYNFAIALIGTLSLTVSLIVSATNPVGGGALNGIIITLSYFTVWSNIIALIVNWMLAADPTRDGLLFRWLRMTALVMIVITGLIYGLILAASAKPCGWGCGPTSASTTSFRGPPCWASSSSAATAVHLGPGAEDDAHPGPVAGVHAAARPHDHQCSG